jgi:hypothetical protein
VGVGSLTLCPNLQFPFAYHWQMGLVWTACQYRKLMSGATGVHSLCQAL